MGVRLDAGRWRVWNCSTRVSPRWQIRRVTVRVAKLKTSATAVSPPGWGLCFDTSPAAVIIAVLAVTRFAATATTWTAGGTSRMCSEQAAIAQAIAVIAREYAAGGHQSRWRKAHTASKAIAVAINGYPKSIAINRRSAVSFTEDRLPQKLVRPRAGGPARVQLADRPLPI